MTRLDYDSEEDPLGYMTANYPSGALYESRIDMSRRMMLRGRHAPKRWQRLLVRAWIVLAVLATGASFLTFAWRLLG